MASTRSKNTPGNYKLEQSVNALPDNYITAKRKLRNEYNPLIHLSHAKEKV